MPSANIVDHEKEMIQPSVDGMNAILQACHQNRVKRLSITSSVAAIVNCPEDQKPECFTEENWTDAKQTSDHYARAKTLAERAAWDFVAALPEDEKIELTTICPGYISGPPLCS